MNAKDPQTIAKFIELRAQKKTYLEIEAELNVHHNTLVEWSRKYEPDIKNLRELQSEMLCQKLGLSRDACLAALGLDIRRLRDELEKRDLKDVPTDKLIKLLADLRKEAKEYNGPLHFTKRVPESAGPEEYPDPTIDWED